MCNIAGYLGQQQAAPILLEMLRKQAFYDGDMSTGVATIYEGKLHYRKIVGTVEDLIAQTDVLQLPGTMGIAHSRPSGDKNEPAYHPFLSMDETMALVTNGTTPKTRYCAQWDAGVDILDRSGYVFQMEKENPEGRSPKLSRNGCYIRPPEARLGFVDYYLKQGKTFTQALALSCAHLYSDNVTVVINERFPDKIFALRTSRPMTVVTNAGETYMATTRYGLPEQLADRAIDLPLFHACEITRSGITITADRMEMEPVSDMTPYTYAEGYRRLEALLKSDRAPLYKDELEFAVNDMRDLWPGNHTFIQSPRLVYDILRQFDAEGRLRREIRVNTWEQGSCRRYYFWLED